jgi:hypothetical protein
MIIFEDNYFLIRIPESGGKAGKGKNKTSTVQFLLRAGSRWMIHYHTRFTVGDTDSKARAIQRAKDKKKEYIDEMAKKYRYGHRRW